MMLPPAGPSASNQKISPSSSVSVPPLPLANGSTSPVKKNRKRENSRATVSSFSTADTTKTVSFSKESPMIIGIRANSGTPVNGGPGLSTSTSLQGSSIEDHHVRIHVKNMFVNYCDEKGALSSSHPGVSAEIQVSHAFLYIGQELPDDVMVPPIKVNGTALCMVYFSEFSVSCRRQHDDSMQLCLRHRVTEETVYVVLMTHAANHHASSSTFPLELSAAAERIDGILRTLKRAPGVLVVGTSASPSKQLSVASTHLSIPS